MESIPTEVLSLIVELACNDDGSTAKALTRVSRRIHAVVQPFIYTTIHVKGQKQIRSIQACLDSRPEHHRRVRHAFISDWTREEISKEENSPEMFDDDVEQSDTHALAIARLIDTIAPSLYTLTFIANNGMTSTTLCARLLATSFPHLEELTLRGFYPYPCVNTMPRLRALHLSGNRNPHGLLQLGSLPDAFPSLTHLRVSGLSEAVSFATELKEAFSCEQKDLEEEDSFAWSMSSLPARLPPNLATLQVQPSKRCQDKIKSPRSGRRAKMEERMMVTFRELIDSLNGDICPVTSFSVLPAPDDSNSEFDMLEREWKASLDEQEPENRFEGCGSSDYTDTLTPAHCALH